MHNVKDFAKSPKYRMNYILRTQELSGYLQFFENLNNTSKGNYEKIYVFMLQV